MMCDRKNKILRFFYQIVCRYNYIHALVHQTVFVQPKSVSDMKTLCLKCMKINIYSAIIKIWPNLDVYKNHMIYQYAKVEQISMWGANGFVARLLTLPSFTTLFAMIVVVFTTTKGSKYIYHMICWFLKY